MLAGSLLAAAALSSHAQQPQGQPGQGDPEAGRAKAYTCTGCHGITGYRNVYPHYHVPKIAGQNYEYLMIALTAYRNGTRHHPTMQAQAQGYSEQDLRDIAAFLSQSGKEGQE